MSINQRILKGISWSLLGAAVARVLGLVTNITVARILAAHDYGRLGIVQSTLGTAGAFAGLGLGMAATKYVGGLRLSDPARAFRILGLTETVGWITSSLAAIGVMFAAVPVAANIFADKALWSSLISGSGLVVFGVQTGIQNGALAGFERFRDMARVGAVTALVTCIFLPIGALCWGVPGAAGGASLGLAAMWFLNRRILRSTHRESGLPEQPLRSCWKERSILWNFAFPAALGALVTAPASWSANAILTRQPDGFSELGTYTAALQWQTVILFIPSSISPAILSLLSHTSGGRYRAEYWRAVGFSILITSASCCLVAGLIILAARPILQVYGSSFVGGGLVLKMVAFTAVPMALANVVGQVIASSGKMWNGFFLNAVWAAIFLSVAWYLIPQFRAQGLAIAYLVAYCMLVILSSAYLIIQRRGAHAQ